MVRERRGVVRERKDGAGLSSSWTLERGKKALNAYDNCARSIINGTHAQKLHHVNAV